LDDRGFLKGGGELGERIAAFDWSLTSIGPIETWPAAMKTTLAFVLRSPVPIVTLWGDTGVMIYNDAYRQFAGGRHPSILGTNVLEGWHEVAEFNANVMQKVYREGGTLSYKDQELTLIRDGTPRVLWTDLEYSPAVDEDGTPLGVIAIVVETTDKVLAEQRRASERRRMLQMSEHSPSFMTLLEGPDHRFALFNPAYQRLVGDRELVGRTVAEALPDAVEQGFLELLDGVFRTGEAYHGTGMRFVAEPTPGGPSFERFIDFVCQPLADDDGEITRIFVSGVDVTERTRAQGALAASEAQFRTLALALPSHIWTAAPDGKLDWLNDRVSDYSGLPLDELVGSGWTSIVHPDDLPAAAERWAAALADGDVYTTEFRLRRADGDYRWHLARAVAIRDDDGDILRWVGTNTDIEQQKTDQAESTADRNRLWTLSQDLMLVCTTEGIITAVNPSAGRLLGWAEHEMIGRSIASLVHPDDVAATTQELDKLDRGAPTLMFENRYRTKSGDYRLLAWSAVPNAGRVHAVGRDITEERSLARDRERIWTLSPVLKLVTDAQGIVTAVNPSWTRALGWAAEETVGRPITEFMPPEERDGSRERLASFNRGFTRPEYQVAMLARDGSPRTIAWTTMPEEGVIYCFGRDVTAEVAGAAALAETEAALRQSQKMEAVGQLTGGIAHDFNNLLQGITGSLEIVQRRVAQGRISELDRFITGASTAANRAAALTHRLLAFSRRQPLDPKPVRANALIASMEDMLRRTIGERVELELVLAGGLWVTRCDPNQLESAILNLAINARDAMPDGGELTIETCNAHLDTAYASSQRGVKPGQYVCVCVTDTGSGMDSDTIAKAFEPFFTTKPIGQGTGLGLSMIYGFAQQSEGYAKIYSEVGKGTTFKLYLPRYRGEADEEETAIGSSEVQQADGEIVLVVEDEPVVRGLIVEELQELGYRAIEAGDGTEGLDILQSKRRIDLLVTDMGLPGLNGRQLADAARTLRPDLKILFMTGYAENAALASGFLDPGMEMITKPFAMEALATRIRAMIENDD